MAKYNQRHGLCIDANIWNAIQPKLCKDILDEFGELYIKPQNGESADAARKRTQRSDSFEAFINTAKDYVDLDDTLVQVKKMIDAFRDQLQPRSAACPAGWEQQLDAEIVDLVRLKNQTGYSRC